MEGYIMEEEKPHEEGDPSTETPVEEVKEEKSPDSTTMIDAANAAALRLEKANAEQKVLLERQEALKVKETLGGSARAGKPKEQSPEDYAKEIMAGIDGVEK